MHLPVTSWPLACPLCVFVKPQGVSPPAFESNVFFYRLFATSSVFSIAPRPGVWPAEARRSGFPQLCIKDIKGGPWQGGILRLTCDPSTVSGTSSSRHPTPCGWPQATSRPRSPLFLVSFLTSHCHTGHCTKHSTLKARTETSLRALLKEGHAQRRPYTSGR
ncbi:hypothetical protein B0H63DRAFT_151460 [Podospora didyma]|uniref:Uncharacterized protein n=1 Tax=Podospora didyma TaxID=330526 RepID=A0AAE0NT05_9PEZI|nr:hypothetical protein B0H63DRAFT_151460 [Podospora didyma]